MLLDWMVEEIHDRDVCEYVLGKRKLVLWLNVERFIDFNSEVVEKKKCLRKVNAYIL